MHIQLLRVESGAGTAALAGDPDATLATGFQSFAHLRLILQRLAVSAGVDSPAILLGSDDVGTLDQASAVFLADPKAGCSQLKMTGGKCVSFTGLVTVSPVLVIKVNGKTGFAPLGSKVAYVFPPQIDSAEILKTLRISRVNGNRHRSLKFKPREDEVSQILLFGGDEISWLKSSSH